MSLNLDYFKTALNGIRQYVQGVQKKLEKDTDKKIKDNTPNWNQNDPEGQGYIENRPFYTEDPVLLGKVTFTATSETKMTYTTTEDDMSLVGDIYALSGDGEVLRININNSTYISRVSFDRGTIYISGAISGQVYYNAGATWTLNIGGSSPTLVTGKTYEVEFLDITIRAKTIPVEYISSEIFEQTYSPIRLGTGGYSTVLGYHTTASNMCSHAEGSCTTASNMYSHAEGYYTTASGESSHAEGYHTTASGSKSHAEGYYTTASGGNSHVSGRYNVPDSEEYYYNVQGNIGLTINKNSTDYLYTSSVSIDLHNGKFISSPKETVFLPTTSAKEIYIFKSTKPDVVYFIKGADSETSSDIHYKTDQISLTKAGTYTNGDGYYNYATIVGNGWSSDRASNAHTLDWSGNAWFAGDVYIGSTSGTNKDDGSKKLATEEYVDGKISDKELILISSTTDSAKKFKITVDDSGTISATEVTT